MNTAATAAARRPGLLLAAGLLLFPLFFGLAQAADPTPGQPLDDAALLERMNQLERELAELRQLILARQAADNSADNSAVKTAADFADDFAGQVSETGLAAQEIEVQETEVAPESPPASAAQRSDGPSLAFHGLIHATVFNQNRSFIYGNGQNAEFPRPGPSGSLSGFDVRNTRLWMDVDAGRLAGDWRASGRVEADFFGGFNGATALSQQQPLPRLRQAYVDLKNPERGTTVRIGQQWELTVPVEHAPTSPTHIAFPLGVGTGMIGWRFPGVVVMQELPAKSQGPNWRLDVGAFTGSWDGPGNNLNYETAGNPGFSPQIQARLRMQHGDWIAYAMAHWARIDLRGVDGTAPVAIKDRFSSTAWELGGRWTPGDWEFRASAYTGRALAQLLGNLSQFGDIRDRGGYVQIGRHLAPGWRAYAYQGFGNPDTEDVINWLGHGSVGRLKNRQSALSLIHDNGPWSIGLEWLHSRLETTTNGRNRQTTDGNQMSLSASLAF